MTATARDTRDPELRWSLEEFGGGLAVGTPQDLPAPFREVCGEAASRCGGRLDFNLMMLPRFEKHDT